MGPADKPCMRPLIGVTTSELRPSGAGTLRRQGEPAHPEMALGMTYLQASRYVDDLVTSCQAEKPPKRPGRGHGGHGHGGKGD